jgi:Ca2+-binding RTX toxin-like protein
LERSTRERIETKEKNMRRMMMMAIAGALMLALTAGAAWAATIIGTPGPDSISVGFTGESDQIFTLEGNDFVDPYDGNDQVYGNENNDNLQGAEDSDKVYGNTGSDTIDLQSNDTPSLFSTPTSDAGYGGAGNDTVLAQDGNFDAINCGAGASDKVFKDPGDTQTKCESVNPTSASAVAAQEDALEKAEELRAGQ